MDEELRQKLLSTKGCGPCAIDFGEGLVNLCKTREKGHDCEAGSIDALKNFLDGAISNDQFRDTIIKLLGVSPKAPSPMPSPEPVASPPPEAETPETGE